MTITEKTNMEGCQGLPDGPRPNSRCDTSVRSTTYDLFLCRECELKRHAAKSTTATAIPPAAQSDTTSLKKKNVKKTTDRVTVQQTDQLSKLPKSNTDQMTLPDGDVSTSSSSSGAAGGVHHKIIINELIACAVIYRDRGTSAELHKLLISFYLPTEIKESKVSCQLSFVLILPTANS
jgi:hypothetical protein